ncbi:ESX secretion-associated protein EspG [Actinokineospora sp. NBRC 105648]|uniref:ESX secretion-associated protein EspG n=1 Tax=Actinokineospora sp. NBRC 105648 TaxID=3032206 RepID=UPI0024A06816|nr:ESX secretion-associated protein EspG [Actinokineospora sp. NBRC 105648]GLZ37679.1 ESX secretion-associated protein EspG [Actinokineospora sp. NBRC 105648]
MPFGAVEVASEPVSLSALEFDVLWEHLAPGTMPLVVKVPSPGKTYEERAALTDRVWAGLEARGLGRKVDVHPEIEHLFAILARPDREVDGRTWIGRGVRLLACALGENDGALAVLSDDGTIRLSRTSPAGLPAAAVGVLPVVNAGPGQSITLRTNDFESAAAAAEGTQKGFENALRSRGVRAEDATALTEMITDVLGTGNFGAAARDRLDRRVRADRVVSFFDTEHGRYVQVRRAAPDKTLWTTISPADNRRLVQQVEDVLADVVRGTED